MSKLPDPPSLPWLSWNPGDKVVVRYKAPDGVHDALGELLETSADYVVIRAKRGDIHIDSQTMITGKKIE